MKVVQQDGKIIAHNYGHAGAGWSLAPGCVHHVTQMLLQTAGEKLQKETPIAIVGAGVIGLFSAYHLLQQGFTNITIYAEKFENITSQNAGGIFMPSKKTPLNIAQYSYNFYSTIARGKHADFTSGAKILPLYCKSREGSGMESYVGVMMQQAKDVTLDFGNGTQRSMVVYDDGLFVDVPVMMQHLRSYAQKHGVTLVTLQVTSFAQLSENIIVHAAGLQAAVLNPQEAMVPVQGHLVMLKNQDFASMQYMISMNVAAVEMTDDGYFMRRCFYFIPKQLDDVHGGLIGATFIDHATDATPHNEQFAKIIDHAKWFYGAI